MPRNRGVRGEQWNTCNRCGRQYPLSHLGYQEGLLICRTRCWDARTLTDDAREQQRIADRIAQTNTEGADTRYIDLPVFFGGYIG